MDIIELKQSDYQDNELAFEYETSDHIKVVATADEKGFNLALPLIFILRKASIYCR